MKKLWVGIAAVITLLGVLVAPSAFADTSNFRFLSFEADYYLSKDDQNRSTLRTTEKLVAEFPNFDQNHGIERALSKEYDGHPVSLSITSVKNDQGVDLHYSTYDADGNVVVRIGEADTYVHGVQVYVIEYTARDVTKNFDGGEEFYWDVNGTGGQQTFDKVSATVHLDPKIAAAYSGRQVCFTGVQGSSDSNCSTGFAADQSETTITASATQPLNARENLSVVVGFQPGTFAKYVAPPTPWWVVALIVLGVIVGIIWYLILPIIALMRSYRQWRLKGRDAAGRGTIIPQYSPPKDTSLLLADVIYRDRMQPGAVSAAIIDLAIRGYIKVHQTDKKEYELQLARDWHDLKTEEQSVITMLFGSNGNINQRIALKDKKDLHTKVTKLGEQVYDQAISAGLMVDTQSDQRKMNVWGIVLAVVGAFTFNPLGVIAGIIIIALAYHMPARTSAGVELREYLLGTKDYMQLAEADRMRVLQSPEGAEKIDTTDNGQLVKLYEKLLPLAMLFGIEKEWSKKFADLYAQPPDWYTGNYSTFNAAVFATSLSGFTSNVTASSFTPPSSSSSSGFSSGGGFSGGGGGGGGSGGW